MRDTELVVTTGGLGPTEDDRTRGALARALGVALRRDPGKESALRQRTAAYGVVWSELQARQADLPEGADWIENRLGSADGFRFERSGRTLVALPGVPEEMRAMVDAGLAGWIGDGPRQALVQATLRIAGRGEGAVDDLLRDLYERPGLEVTTLGTRDGVDVRLRAEAENLDQVRAAMLERLGADVFAEDDRSLAEVVGRLLERRGETLSAAESCTGGLIAAEATSVPGSSAWFLGGWVVYHNALKRAWAGIPAATLDAGGAVSESVARRLAEAVRRESGSDWGIGVTGVAGPAGGSEDKPVGLVHVALASSAGTEHWETRHPGDRARVRRRTTAFCFDRLRRALAG